MPDPSVLPWGLVWCGLILIVSGLVLTWHGIGQRRPSRVADMGSVVVAMGFVLVIGPLLVNGSVLITKAIRAYAQDEASASTDDNAYPQR